MTHPFGRYGINVTDEHRDQACDKTRATLARFKALVTELGLPLESIATAMRVYQDELQVIAMNLMQEHAEARRIKTRELAQFEANQNRGRLGSIHANDILGSCGDPNCLIDHGDPNCLIDHAGLFGGQLISDDELDARLAAARARADMKLVEPTKLPDESA